MTRPRRHPWRVCIDWSLHVAPGQGFKPCQTVPRSYIFGRCFADTYRIGNLRCSPSSMHQALAGNVCELIRNNILHNKCEIFTYYCSQNHFGCSSATWLPFKTVPMTRPLHCSVIEGYCHSVCVITDSMCLPRRASRARILHSLDGRSLIACKSMGKIFILGRLVTIPAWDVGGSSADHGKLLWLKIGEELTKQHSGPSESFVPEPQSLA